jgi:hypothetical protein
MECLGGKHAGQHGIVYMAPFKRRCSWVVIQNFEMDAPNGRLHFSKTVEKRAKRPSGQADILLIWLSADYDGSDMRMKEVNQAPRQRLEACEIQ